MRALVALVLLPSLGHADHPVVEAATIDGDRVTVTLSHPDTGWDHYADGWEVLDADGNSLGLRTLFHPHVEEQPFTRSLSGVEIPTNAEVIYIRARCNVDGWSDRLFELRLP